VRKGPAPLPSKRKKDDAFSGLDVPMRARRAAESEPCQQIPSRSQTCHLDTVYPYVAVALLPADNLRYGPLSGRYAGDQPAAPTRLAFGPFPGIGSEGLLN
jgi:hypothetical protein